MVRCLLLAVAILAGVLWAVLFGLAVQGRENQDSRDARTAAFVLLVAAGSLYPILPLARSRGLLAARIAWRRRSNAWMALTRSRSAWSQYAPR
jgi:hypothetical protein